MTQLICKAEPDVRLEIGIPLGALWIGGRNAEAEKDREAKWRAEYPSPRQSVERQIAKLGRQI